MNITREHPGIAQGIADAIERQTAIYGDFGLENERARMAAIGWVERRMAYGIVVKDGIAYGLFPFFDTAHLDVACPFDSLRKCDLDVQHLDEQERVA